MKKTPFAAATESMRDFGVRLAATADALAEREAAESLRAALERPGVVNRMVYFSVLVQVRPGAPDHEVIAAAADFMRSVPDVLETLADRVSPETEDD